MSIEMIKRVLAMGDVYGSALRDMLKWLKICDLVNVTDEQAQMYIDYREGGAE